MKGPFFKTQFGCEGEKDPCYCKHTHRTMRAVEHCRRRIQPLVAWTRAILIKNDPRLFAPSEWHTTAKEDARARTGAVGVEY